MLSSVTNRKNRKNLETTKMTNRAPLFFVTSLALGLLATSGCLQQLDSHASDGVTSVKVDPNGGLGAPFAINTTTPDIGLSLDDPSQTTTDPCVKVNADAVQVRMTFCNRCHQGEGIVPILNDIDNDSSMINTMADQAKYPGWKLLVPGDLDKSLIYHRVVVAGDMPPAGTIDAPVLSPSISDMSVLREWILCMGATSPAAPATGTN